MPISYRIHPGIGVARVGDSTDDYFLGPESPGVRSTLIKADTPALPVGQTGSTRTARRPSSARVHDSGSTHTPRTLRTS